MVTVSAKPRLASIVADFPLILSRLTSLGLSQRSGRGKIESPGLVYVVKRFGFVNMKQPMAM